MSAEDVDLSVHGFDQTETCHAWWRVARNLSVASWWNL